ncbi:MFS transporter [Streptomyces sp. NPDC052107]|uniref:MFS transporter n=1 Tax=Streptomyces sp. NPDC052107 TaxID=3155632 RepID=UPI00342C94F0
MAASGLAAIHIPLAGWRVPWFAQLPLVLILIAVNRWIPESAAFTARQARPEPVPASALFKRPQTAKTVVVSAYALAWGLVYWGFITFLPSHLESSGGHGMSAAALLFISSLLAIPTCAVAAWLYMRWSARGTMVVYAALTVAALLVLAAVGMDGSRPVLLTAVMLLFAGTAGVISWPSGAPPADGPPPSANLEEPSDRPSSHWSSRHREACAPPRCSWRSPWPWQASPSPSAEATRRPLRSRSRAPHWTPNSTTSCAARPLPPRPHRQRPFPRRIRLRLRSVG